MTEKSQGTDTNVPELDAIAASLLSQADAAGDLDDKAQPHGQPLDDDRDAAADTAGDTDDDLGVDAPDADEADDSADEFDFLDELGLRPDTSEEDFDEDADDEDEDGKVTHIVRVEGEDREVPLSELKRIYSLGAATKKRLEEATLERKRAFDEGMTEAREAADKLFQDAQQRAGVIRTAYEQFNHVLFAPMAEAPDPGLRATDPTEFAVQMADWQADQERIRQQQAEMQGVLAEAQRIDAERKAAAIQREKEALIRKVPGLDTPEKAKVYRDAVHLGAKGVGFTDDEIASALDHRLFIMAAKAHAFDRVMTQMRGGGKPAPRAEADEGQPQRRRRKAMRPGGGGPGGNRQRRNAAARKRHAEAVERARKTGDVDDVAATLLI